MLVLVAAKLFPRNTERTNKSDDAAGLAHGVIRCYAPANIPLRPKDGGWEARGGVGGGGGGGASLLKGAMNSGLTDI